MLLSLVRGMWDAAMNSYDHFELENLKPVWTSKIMAIDSQCTPTISDALNDALPFPKRQKTAANNKLPCGITS